MTPLYTSTRFEVTGQVADIAEPLSLAAWVFAPTSLPVRPIVLVCLPGGSYTKAYYHLEVPGFAPDAYSFALHMAKQGLIVVALDHLGTGESSMPADGKVLSLQAVAQANAVATEQVRTRLSEGELIAGMAPMTKPFLVGIGHSMGAFLLVAQQANHRNFDAITPLGYTNHEPSISVMVKHLAEQMNLPDESSIFEVLAQMYHFGENGYTTTDRSVAHALFHTKDVPAEVIEADDQLATVTPTGISYTLSTPGFMPPLAATIEVPVFLCNADEDISSDFHGEPATYPLARDITLFQLAGSAHCHNFATTRMHLWDRFARWIQEIVPA